MNNGVIKYFIDCEFDESHGRVDLISMGLVCEDGRELYLAVSTYDTRKAHPWLRRNVLPHLPPESERRTKREIADKICEFMAPDVYGKPELWGYYNSYDFVAFCSVFGRMIDLPRDMPRYANELRQLSDQLGNPRLPRIEEGTKHNALDDARRHKVIYERLVEKGAVVRSQGS